MSMRRQVCRMGAVLAILTATLTWQPRAAVAGKRSLCGVTGCTVPDPKISWARLLVAFSKAYWTGYKAGHCDRNVNRLVSRLHKAGMNLQSFQVLYLLPTRRFAGRLAMDSSRNITAIGGRVSRVNWTFHVVLRLGNNILDLDYGRAPTIVRFDKYFRSMWAAGTKPRLGVRAIPATEYLREYSSTAQHGSPPPKKNYGYYLYDKGHRYRLFRAQRYLKKP